MSLTVTDIAAAFSHHEFQDTYDYMLDDIEWMLVGERHIRGKVNVVATCEESSKYLTTVRTRFITFTVIEAENSVVIDSRAEYVDAEGESSLIASCDIYEFDDGNLAAITSYTVELDGGRED
jgi:limonene-1,2-epoxide hydrolase